MSPIRVLIVDMPRILHDIVHATLAAERDIVVGASPEDGLSAVLAEFAPAVLVLGADHPAAADGCRELLEQHAELKLLTVADDGAQTHLVEMRPAATPLGELSPATLVSAIRSAAVPA